MQIPERHGNKMQVIMERSYKRHFLLKGETENGIAILNPDIPNQWRDRGDCLGRQNQQFHRLHFD